jgi:hypothetical protein
VERDTEAPLQFVAQIDPPPSHDPVHRGIGAGLDKLGDTLGADFVTPLVVYLASEDCMLTQKAFSAAWGRYARVFVGATAGWYGPRDLPAAPEDLREHLSEITDRSRYFVPGSVYDEAGYVIENLPAARGR